MTTGDLDADIAAAASSHQRLLADIEGLSDADVWQPSLLPDWTVGHVLTHLARNAEGLARMARGAERGEVVDQYVGGAAGRDADIEAGARRPGDVIVADVRMTIFLLEQAWDEATDRGWAGTGHTVRGDMPIAIVPSRRTVECEIHHADLGLGYTPADWPSPMVRRELPRLASVWASRQPMGLTELPAAVLALSESERLAWLVGRREIEGIAPAGVMG